jgi:hypothetical protein
VTPLLGESSFTHTMNTFVGMHTDKNRVPRWTLRTVDIKNFYMGNFHYSLAYYKKGTKRIQKWV